MASPETSIARTQGGFDYRDLQRQANRAIPYAEWAARVRHGRDLDLHRIDAAIRYADGGLMWPLTDLVRESLALNLYAQGLVGRRFTPLATADWDLSAAEGDGISTRDAERIANVVRSYLRALDMQQAIFDLAYAYLDGRAAHEVEWDLSWSPTGGRRCAPRSLNWILPQRLSFSQTRDLVVVDRWTDSGGFEPRGEALCEQPGRFVTFTPRMFSDLQEREGLGPRFVYWLFFDRMGWRQRIVLSEKFALPWCITERDVWDPAKGGGIMRVPRNEDPADDFGAAVQETNQLKADGTWQGEPGEHLRLEYPPAELDDFFSQTTDQIMDRLSMLTLHRIVSKDDARAGEVVKKKDEDALFQLQGGAISGVIQRALVNVIVELNFGADALPLAPTFQIRTAPERDRKAELERADILVNKLNVQISRAGLYEASGFKPPRDAADVVGPKPAPAAPALPGAPPPAAATAPEDAGSDDAASAMRELLEAADYDDQADAADVEARAGWARFALAREHAVQPSIANGSPEVLVERGTRDGARASQRWADELLDAADGSDIDRIYRRLDRIGGLLDLGPMARAVERRLVHGLMLGGLDADYEATEDVVIAPAAFDTQRSTSAGVKDFVALPFVEAIRAFTSKQVLPRDLFDRLLGHAKRTAFTVAGLARREMLAVAHDELSKAIESGADLRNFSRALSERFDSAGWTRLNPSHVETVFRTNVMGAYGAGRTQQMSQPAVLAARPYWQILGVDDSRTRDPHRRAQKKVLPASDPFWQSVGAPPWGFNCRDRIVSRSPADLKRLGLTATTGAALRGLPDPGWDSKAVSYVPSSAEPRRAPAPAPLPRREPAPALPAPTPPPPAAPSPATPVEVPEPPAAAAPRFEELPETFWPEGAKPPAGADAAGWKQVARERVSALADESLRAVRRFTNGWDWTIRELEKGQMTEPQIADALRAHWGEPTNLRMTAEQWIDRAKGFSSQIGTAFETATPTPATVYRGLKNLSREQVDGLLRSKTVTMAAVTSTSWNPTVARSFATDERAEGTMAVLFRLEQRSGIAIETTSDFDFEREIILRKGTTLTVVGHERIGDDVLVIHAREE